MESVAWGGALLKLFGVALAFAATIAPYSTTTPQVAIDFWADYYHVSRTAMYDTIKCESGFDPTIQSYALDPHGPNGHEDSWGLVQIHLSAHPEVTKTEALDPDWSLQWMAQAFAAGDAKWWSCYRGDNKLAAKSG